MEFCKKCGAIITSNKNLCPRCNKDDIKKENLIQQEKEYIRKKKDYLSFPDPQSVSIFRLKQPEKIIKKQRESKISNNSTTIPFYEFMKKLIKEYPPINLRWIKGNTWAKGDITNKYSLILIRNKFINEIKQSIEGFILKDGEHYSLELLEKSNKDKKELIKSITHEMEKEWELKELCGDIPKVELFAREKKGGWDDKQ